tara:strand:- start:1445 stop:1759 length:315 start_codon:yes stop_codon:yes gene_type:complete
MNRSDEIIKLFQSINIPRDITKKILDIEKNDIIKKSYRDWYYIQIQNINYKNTLFCEEFYRGLLLNDIVHINGNFKTLNYHINCYRKLKRESEEQALFIMSFRF